MPETDSSHPSPEQLRAFSLCEVDGDELERTATHLNGCPACRALLDDLFAHQTLLSQVRAAARPAKGVCEDETQRRRAALALVHRERHDEQDGRPATLLGPSDAPVPRSAPEHEPALPRQVGEYEVMAEVGRGGMGVVYKARHHGLHRLVALKMMLSGLFASPKERLRFRLEAELAARVQHPNIVQVYEVGTHEGRPFLALEWVEGGSLAERLDGKPWPPGEAALLVETLARAIHVAHCEGVVHRDIKPANILLQGEREKEKEQREDGAGPSLDPLPFALATPKIADFGLAQPVAGGQTLTQSGFLAGTPGYMAPEQAAGKRALVGPSTDTYALGVVLYQLLTGQLPFPGDSCQEVLRAVLFDEPARPRRLQPRLPRDLEAVMLHCLEKEPARRYPSTLALAEDLQRFREGKQVLARPVGTVARLARACRRRPVITLLLVLLMLSLFGGLGGVTWKWLEADEQRELANAHARQADEEKQAALYQAYRARLAAAGAALQYHDVADAAQQLDDPATEDLRGWEWQHYHSRLDDSSAVIPFPDGGSGILVPGPDRLRVGIVTGDGLRLTDLDGGEPVTVPFRPDAPRAVAAAETRLGLRVAVWAGGTFDVLDEAGRRVCHMDVPGGTQPRVAVGPDGNRLAWPKNEGGWERLRLGDATSGKPTVTCEGHRENIWAFAFSPDGTRIATAGEDRTARLWDPATGALLATYWGHTSKVLGVAFSPDGTRLLTTSSDRTVRQWDVGTGREAQPPYDRHTDDVVAAVYSSDREWVASAGADRTVRVWRATDRQDVAVLHGHTGNVAGVAFAPGPGRRLASLSRALMLPLGGDDTVRVWDVDPRATLPVLRGHTDFVYPVAFSPDGRWIASGSWDHDVRLWDAATGEPCAKLPHSGVVFDLAFGPDGTWLVSGTLADSRLRVWDVAAGLVRKEIALPAGRINSVTVRPDGRRLAATVVPPGDVPRLRVCDVESGECLFSAEGAALAYSPDGRWLAVRDADEKTIALLDAQTHEPAARFRGHQGRIAEAAFSPDSRRLASCGQDRIVRVWQVDGGACQELPGHTNEVFAVAFHPGGTRLASAGRDRAVWLWDLARGAAVARLQGHTSYVWSLAFSPDGTTLASGSGDGTVRLWDTAPLRARYEARAAEALRHEAERLIEPLWREKNDPAEAAKALRADRVLSEPLRQAALRAVLRKAAPPEAASGNPHDSP